MSWENYHNALLALPITIADTPTLPPIFPHIPKEKALEKLVQDRYIACPPLVSQDSFLVLQLRNTTMTPQSTRSVTKIVLAGAKRLGAIKDLSVSNMLPSDIPYWNDALLYANINWPSKLRNTADWTNLLEIRLQNLSTKHMERRLILVLSKDYGELEQSRAAPRHRIIDAHIKDIFVDPIELIEVLGGRKPFCLHMCAVCGAGINNLRCDVCDRAPQPIATTTLPPIPVPPKVCAQLWLTGHKFDKDPSEAQAREHLLWRRICRVT